MDEIDLKLKSVFPNGNAVIVQDIYSGFRDRSGELVLLVEVAKSDDQNGIYVVEFGPEGKLAKELEDGVTVGRRDFATIWC